MNSHRVLMCNLLLMCSIMFTFAFALVPLYDVFCRYTGINGKTAKTAALASTNIDDSREITVEFLAISDALLPWTFSPEMARIQIHPGQIKIVNFYAENTTDNDMIGQAVPSVSPGESARYFKKMECFCFTEQPLKAHQHKMMPVQFYIDPALPPQISTITLSYRMYKSIQ